MSINDTEIIIQEVYKECNLLQRFDGELRKGISRAIQKISTGTINTTQTDPTSVTMVTINKAAELTGVSYSYIRSLCLTKQIVFVKTGCKYLINLEKFVAFLNGNQNEVMG
ncbi:helix-turn-helix domain-containing protein [Anaerosporobacter faecicola]|uniref:helix-turn-helix domain-containing protein n=1 Tax=Anaerosporobacter faecicola TaxID=2718714 RepID=UPI00143940E0|nr:helix-turn-helix domain-containing protein [Anaerosporobacter faecicola]